MNIKLNAVGFDANDKLQQFVNKKTEKLARLLPDDAEVRLNLKVEAPQTTNNKTAALQAAGQYVEKTADTFELAINDAIDALKTKLVQLKDK